MLTQLKQYWELLNDSYRHVILRQAIVWIQTGMEIHNPLNSADIVSLKKKAPK